VAGRGSIRFSAQGCASGQWSLDCLRNRPADDQTRRSGYRGGSAIFIAERGGAPVLVAGRGDGSIWNECPAFSPSGKLLAFGRKSPQGQSIRVVAVSRKGSIGDASTVVAVHRSTAPCPKSSADGKRLGYLDSNGKLVVTTIGGERRARRAGDPTISSFSRDDDALVSPVAWRNGTSKRPVDVFPCSGWSPDSRKLLVMKDMDGLHFAIVLISVKPDADSVAVVTGVQVNHARSWPGYGDVSWQPEPARG
jgi:hypothetical protein